MAKDIILSEHFRLSEFTNSYMAKRLGIDNTPSLAVVSNLQQLCRHVLEPLRQYAGCPIIISSGYRCPSLNQAVGGVSKSQHLVGEAADIVLPSTAVGRQWLGWLMDQKFDQLIFERASVKSSTFWLHVSYRQVGHNRQQVIDGLTKI